MADQTKTMVKATVNPAINETIEEIQAANDYTKAQATHALLTRGHLSYRRIQSDDHRLADAEPDPERLTDAQPEAVPGDAPRDDAGDPILNDQ